LTDLEASLQKELEHLRFEVNAVIDQIPGNVRVREGGGPENLAASLAVSVNKLVEQAKVTQECLGELK